MAITYAALGTLAAASGKVFGLPLDTAWARWIAWERDFQQANLRAIRAHPPTRNNFV